VRPLAFSSRPISSGRSGTIATLREMAKLSRAGSAHPDVIRAAQNVARRAPERDDRATMRAMLADVRRRMRYTKDPLGVELVKAPWTSIGQSDLHGVEPMDCDDASVMLASMLGAVGIPSRFVVVSTDKRRPRDFSHVYLHAQASDGSWVPLDPIVRDFDVGDEVPAERLTGPRGAMNVSGVGCEGCNGDCRGCKMSGLNGESGMGGAWETIERLGNRYIDARTGRKGQRQGAAVKSDALTDAALAAASKPQGPSFADEWLTPFRGGAPNWKSIGLFAVVGYVGLRYMKKGRRRR
jgi:hypothetical protein